MKRLLGFLCLIFSILFLSCNNGLSDKTGDINFSFDVNDAIRAATSDEDEGTVTREKEYIFLVQVKGSNDFYDYQMKSVKINYTVPEQGNINGYTFGQTIAIYDPAEDSINYVKENEAELNFTFGYVPTNQKYKVMFDMFEKIPSYDYAQGQEISETTTQYRTTHVLSGHSADLQVNMGMPTKIEVDIDRLSDSPISLTVEYEDSGSKNIPIPAFNALDESQWDAEQINSKLTKKYGKLWYEDEDENEDTDAKPIKDIYYSLDSSSNYADSSFKYSISHYYFGEDDEYLNFTFNGNSYSVKDFLMNYSFPVPEDYAQLERPDYSLRLNSFAEISRDDLNFIENIPSFQYESEDEVISGQTSKRMTFTKYQYEEDNDTVYAYAATVDLLNRDGDGLDIPLNDEDSAALVLTVKGSNQLPASTDLFYKTRNNPIPKPGELENYYNYGDNLFGEDSHHTKHATGETRFVIPINKFNRDKHVLQLLVKGDTGSEQVTCTYDIDWYVFPEDMGAFVLDVSSPTGQYRYQILELAHTERGDLQVQNEQEYVATLKGNVCRFDTKTGNFSPFITELTTELQKTEGDYAFVVPNTPKLTTREPRNLDETPEYNFQMTTNRDLGSDGMKCKVMCYTNCPDTNYLMVIRDYELYVEEKQ